MMKAIFAIINSNISKITVSLDYFDEKEYNTVKKGDYFRVIRNIETLLEYKKKFNRKIIIQINMLYQKHKLKQIENAITYFDDKLLENDFIYSRYIKDLADQVNIKTEDTDNWFDLTEFRQSLSKKINIDKYKVENWCEFLELNGHYKKGCLVGILFCIA